MNTGKRYTHTLNHPHKVKGERAWLAGAGGGTQKHSVPHSSMQYGESVVTRWAWQWVEPTPPSEGKFSW